MAANRMPPAATAAAKFVSLFLISSHLLISGPRASKIIELVSGG
jgi:hypothetical protein